MLNVLLLDDDPTFLEVLKVETERVLSERGFTANVYQAMSAGDAEIYLENTDEIALALLDIDMGAGTSDSQNGLHVAQLIRDQKPGCAIVFVTAFLSFATEVYEVEPIYFILKEQLKDRLVKAIHAFQRKYDRQQRYISVASGKTDNLIQVTSILYCERNNRRTKIVTIDGETITNENLNTIAKKLPEDQFACCHKGFIVGLRWVMNYDRFLVKLTNGCTLPISRSHREQFRKSVARFMLMDMQE